MKNKLIEIVKTMRGQAAIAHALGDKVCSCYLKDYSNQLAAAVDYTDNVFRRGWSFIAELDAHPFERPLASCGLVYIDLSDVFDRGAVRPYKDATDGTLNCTCGTREIARVWEYRDDEPLTGRFYSFIPVSLVDFVRCFCDAAAFDGVDESEIQKAKEEYGV